MSGMEKAKSQRHRGDLDRQELFRFGGRFETKISVVLNDVLDEFLDFDLHDLCGHHILHKGKFGLFHGAFFVSSPSYEKFQLQLDGIAREADDVDKVFNPGLGEIDLKGDGSAAGPLYL